MTISQASLDRLVHQYRLAPPNRVVLVWNGVDLERFSEPVRQEDLDAFRQRLGVRGDPVIGAIARLSPVKGLDHLIRAVPGLMQRFPNIQLLLVGDGPAKDDLVRLAYQLGIADRVAICPSVEDTRLPLALMQVFVAPSLEEGFGLATVEAMAVGVPVVVSRVGGLSQVVEHGLSGWVVPPADPEAIRLAVEHLLSDSQLRQNIAQAARKRVQERFDFNRTVLEVEQVYRQAVDPNRR
jgi:glycosyltransferase involved in cell wall biosynthesis